MVPFWPNADFKADPVPWSVTTLLIALLVEHQANWRVLGTQIQSATFTADPITLLVDSQTIVLGMLNQASSHRVKEAVFLPVFASVHPRWKMGLTKLPESCCKSRRLITG